MECTPYFLNQVLRKRPYLQLRWCLQAIKHPIATLHQPDGRIRHWIYLSELDRFLRVVTLQDGRTIHNAFFDRGFHQRPL